MCNVVLPACVSVHHVCAVAKEARKGSQISWNQSYEWLWAMWVLENNLAASATN